ncbi:MAG: acyl-CoA dehydrogenase family protein [Pseudomonadota bacterium]
MQTMFTQDQEQFREVVARFLQDKSPPTAVRKLMESEQGYDSDVWKQLCDEVGLAGTHIPEEYGGFGFGPIELGIVAEEMGRYLYCGPFFASSVMAGYALLGAATENAKKEILPAIASGETIATLVLDNLSDPKQVGQVIQADAQNALTGSASIVVDAHIANLLIVIANTSNGLGLFSVNSDVAGISVSSQEALDPTRKISRVTFGNAAAEKLGDVSSEALNQIWDQICVALAHEMVGGAQYLFDSTIEYTKMRVQFGRPIGSFQALKHRCADLLMEVEFAKAATWHAARCLDANDGEAYAPSMAKALASDTYMSAAKAGVQLRGGIGFTWENDTHLWFKRAKSSEVFMGSPASHRERMMQIMEETEHA